MALGWLDIHAHSRSRGHSIAAAVAYRFRTELLDKRTGRAHDYAIETDTPVATGIVHGATAPAWGAQDLQAFADAFEHAETRVNSTVGRDIQVSVPHELTTEQGSQALAVFAQTVAEDLDTVVPWAMHTPSVHGDGRNSHGHVFVPDRRLDPDTGQPGKKLEEFRWTGGRGPATVRRIRQTWETIANDALAQAGHDVRIDMGPGGNRRDAPALPRLTRETIRAERQARDLDDGDTKRVGEGDLPTRGRQSIEELLTDGRCVTREGQKAAAAYMQALIRHQQAKAAKAAMAASVPYDAEGAFDGPTLATPRAASASKPDKAGRRSLEERRANRQRRRRSRQDRTAPEPVATAAATAPDPNVDEQLRDAIAAGRMDTAAPADPLLLPPTTAARAAPAAPPSRKSLKERRAGRKRRRRAADMPAVPARPATAMAPAAPRLQASTRSPDCIDLHVRVRVATVFEFPGWVHRTDPTSGAISYARASAPGQALFVNEGARVRVRGKDDDTIKAALKVAHAQSGHRTVRIRGGAEFRQRALAMARQLGIPAVDGGTRRAPGPAPQPTPMAAVQAPRPSVRAAAPRPARQPATPAPVPAMAAKPASAPLPGRSPLRIRDRREKLARDFDARIRQLRERLERVTRQLQQRMLERRERAAEPEPAAQIARIVTDKSSTRIIFDPGPNPARPVTAPPATADRADANADARDDEAKPGWWGRLQDWRIERFQAKERALHEAALAERDRQARLDEDARKAAAATAAELDGQAGSTGAPVPAPHDPKPVRIIGGVRKFDYQAAVRYERELAQRAKAAPDTQAASQQEAAPTERAKLRPAAPARRGPSR